MKLTDLALAAAILAPTGVLAHSKAEQTIPENNATVASVETIEIRFDDPMRVTAITMTGPDGAVDIARETGLDAVTEFRASPAQTLGAGAYQVDWRGLASDGHPMQGSFRFSIVE